MMADPKPASGARLVRLEAVDDKVGWQRQVRTLLALDVPPSEVVFEVAGVTDLFGGGGPTAALLPGERASPVLVPRAAADLASTAIDHSDPGRFALLYRFLWRSLREKGLAANPADPDTVAVRRLEKAVRRDLHKMHAFVRFRELKTDEATASRFVAWFEPDHHIVETTAPFFIRRFTNMDWAIVTPGKSIRWDGQKLTVGDGGKRSDVPEADDFEAAWSAYYASIFNPARVKVKAMQAEMPKKYWRNLPEAAAIPELIRNAPGRVKTMTDAALDLESPDQLAAPRAEGVPADVEAVRDMISGCTRCPLYEGATQAVPGEGPSNARLFFVGEQPGDLEDREGRPFIGPAGQLLRDTLQDLGIDEDGAYVTNAVKHFKFLVRGKRRVHQTPSAREIDICADFVRAEREAVKPAVTVTLGASALRSMLGRAQPLKNVRGEALEFRDGGILIATFHPAYLLRLPDAQGRAIETEKFRRDLAKARDLLEAA